jgi:hypothetical protein
MGRESYEIISVFASHKQFEEGREDMKDNERNGHPSSHSTDESVEKVRNPVHLERR